MNLLSKQDKEASSLKNRLTGVKQIPKIKLSRMGFGEVQQFA